MVDRIYVEKRAGFRQEAAALLRELRTYLKLETLSDVRIIHRYDAENVEKDVFSQAAATIFSEPTVDDRDFTLTLPKDARVFAVEALPGQFDQRADSAAQCIQLITLKERPRVRYAKVYVLFGDMTRDDIKRIKNYVINPVECREAAMGPHLTLAPEMPAPASVPRMDGFRQLDMAALERLLAQYDLAMDPDDLQFVQLYFLKEGRDPTLTELRVMDTYWSDHCRHTTFSTELVNVTINDPLVGKSFNKYVKLRERLQVTGAPTLMDVATIAVKALKSSNKLNHLDESEEINACTLRITIDASGAPEDWLLLFKNETHNHPTEIEPFGGAATCIGGAIRDPLSARGYVYAAMRVTGAADPTEEISATMPGKLPQRRICIGAADGFSSYGNQIGLATGMVREMYHPGYAAKRLETGAVLGAVPRKHVIRERPQERDIVILVGGRTGRDGIGGATGSSKSHTLLSVEQDFAQVQKGNAPEERKLQRLFLNPLAAQLIKRCNDFGAGGVAVAIGELADGLDIDLDKVPRKYAGLDGTEIAISESQERMAVVVAPEDADDFCRMAHDENLEATAVAVVTGDKRMVMRWQGQTIVDLDRTFLSSNGAGKKTDVVIAPAEDWQKQTGGSFREQLTDWVSSLNGCSQRGLAQRFDATIGAASVMMPFGGRFQLTAPDAMVHVLPVPGGTDTASYMAFGCNPAILEKSPYHGAYLAVVESVTNLIATGASSSHIYLSLQEYFARPGKDPARFGAPLAALLGAQRAQMELGIAAIGGKDSMSGTFENLDVPPTLISFAITWDDKQHALSPEFKRAGSRVVWMRPKVGADGLPLADALRNLYDEVEQLMRSGRVLSSCSVRGGGAAGAVFNACLGNGIGFTFHDNWDESELFGYAYGSIILEMADNDPVFGETLGKTGGGNMQFRDNAVPLGKLQSAHEGILEKVYPAGALTPEAPIAEITSYANRSKGGSVVRPRVLIPVFQGTSCELDTARAFEKAGAAPDIFIVRNTQPGDTAQSVEAMAYKLQRSQIVLITGGFSGGDEPDGAGKMIAAFLRNPQIADGVQDLLHKRGGLLGGICNGFQALIKLGLLPYGRIVDLEEGDLTLTHNLIGRHQSRIVRVKTCSTLSPWFLKQEVGDILPLAISHGEGRLICSPSRMQQLASNGQIAAQYVDLQGNPSMDILFNPSGSSGAVEALTSPDGRIMGRMGHSERMLRGLYKNIPGVQDDPLFSSAVSYFA